MGNHLWTSVKEDTRTAVSGAVVRSKLIDIKSQKSKRDQELAFKVATVRERIQWLAGFYVTLIGFNFARMKITKEAARFSPLPLAWLPYIGTPFLFLYQVDFAYGTKLERLNLEAQHILKNEKHWFNNPVRLPRSFEIEYRKLIEESKVKCPDEPMEEWAVFSDAISREEISLHTFPATKLINFAMGESVQLGK